MSRSKGDGSAEQRGEGIWRLRYSVDGKRFTQTVRCETKKEALAKLREILNGADNGAHVAPNKVTVAERVETWLGGLQVGAKTAERYGQLLRGHVVPHLGSVRLQKLSGDEIDKLYSTLEGKISARTRHHVHVVLGTMLRHAVKKGVLHRNPIDAATAPRVDDAEAGKALGADALQQLAKGFAKHPLRLFVAAAIGTGCRRNELLALTWDEVDLSAGAVRIVRAVEKTIEHGIRTKAPKTKTGVRTITIDAGLVALLRAERDRHLRIAAGIPDGAGANLSLLKLPQGALCFPSPGANLCKLRDPDAVTAAFMGKAAELGFSDLRLHDLRHTHGSRLIAAGLPVPAVAARLGHTAEVLLRCYAHEIKDAEGKQQTAKIVADLAIPSA
jgi:integrase